MDGPFRRVFLFSPKNMVLKARSELAGFAGEEFELFWSTGGIEIPNSKSVLVIEYWNLRFVCNLVLGI